jgi:hypothetical protein
MGTGIYQEGRADPLNGVLLKGSMYFDGGHMMSGDQGVVVMSLGSDPESPCEFHFPGRTLGRPTTDACQRPPRIHIPCSNFSNLELDSNPGHQFTHDRSSSDGSRHAKSWRVDTPGPSCCIRL